MADLKPIGSERLQGQEKINRILEISRYKEITPSNINETSRVEFEKTLADGHQYEIIKEKTGYIIKKRINESLDYIEPMKNRTYYRSYSQALKRLNLMAGEINRLFENEEDVSMYQISEQKRFTLKTPKAPMPEPAAELPPPAPAPEEGSMDAPLDDASLDMPIGDEMDMDMELDTPEGDMDMSSEEEPMAGEEEDVTFKTIQKLTGKLGQKIRMMNDSVGMTSEDVKYVINSLLSALDLSKLDEEDQEDIMSKFEEDQESDYDSDMDMGSMGDDEDMDVDMDMEEPIEGEMEEGMYGSYNNDEMGSEMSEEDKVNSHVSKVMDEIFSESKVDKVLSSYFVVNENEQKTKTKKLVESKQQKSQVMDKVKKLSETYEQELASEFILQENNNFKFVGKTNKSNLVFEHDGEQIRVTPKGEVL